MGECQERNMSSSATLKVVVGLSSAAAGFAGLACLVVIPSLFTKINEMQTRVNDNVQVCKSFPIFDPSRLFESTLMAHGVSSWKLN